MTTAVKVIAHCGSENQVNILIKNKETGEILETTVLADGEETEVYCYDDRIVDVRETKIVI